MKKSPTSTTKKDPVKARPEAKKVSYGQTNSGSMENAPKEKVETTSEGYNPLAQQVDEKSYAGGGAAVAQQLNQNPNQVFAEPDFAPPPNSGDDSSGDIPTGEEGRGFSSNKNAGDDDAGRSDGSLRDKAKKEFSGFNPQLEEATDAEKKEAAERMADMAIGFYGLGKKGMGSFAKISDKKLRQLQMSGKIDLNVLIEMQNGSITLRDFASDFNNQVGEAMELSEDFVKSARPPLVRILQKRGHGMTDEQQLGLIVLQDLLMSGMQVFQLRATSRDIMAFAERQTAAMYSHTRAAAKVAAEEVVKHQQPVEQNLQQEQEDISSGNEEGQVVSIQDQIRNKYNEKLGNTKVAKSVRSVPGKGRGGFGSPEKIAGLNKVAKQINKSVNKTTAVKKLVKKSAKKVAASKVLVAPPDGTKRTGRKGLRKR